MKIENIELSYLSMPEILDIGEINLPDKIGH